MFGNEIIKKKRKLTLSLYQKFFAVVVKIRKPRQKIPRTSKTGLTTGI